MAVYKRVYKGYAGPTTPRWSRALILTRYSYARLFQNRFLAIFLALCFFYPIFCIAYVYLMHNDNFLSIFRIRSNMLYAVDGRFFYFFCYVQGALSYLLVAFVGPNLVSPDLVNGAMPLYFSRPFSRIEYVLGRMSVLVILLSLITWVPGLAVYIIEGTIAGWAWFIDNLWLAQAIVLGFLVWIIVLSFIALALSALIKWKIAAGAAVLAIFFAGAGFGNAINAVMRTNYGALINLTDVIHIIWADLMRYNAGFTLAASDAWISLGVIAVLCAALLARRIRAFEVVK
jgi:ABC-2 type transport system permease protein